MYFRKFYALVITIGVILVFVMTIWTPFDNLETSHPISSSKITKKYSDASSLFPSRLLHKHALKSVSHKIPYTFTRELCSERKYYMNWKKILSPCKQHMKIGENMLPRSEATSAPHSRVVNNTARPTGDYSTIIIKTYTAAGTPKKIGGDEWRVRVEGPSTLEPLVQDLNDGSYKVSFLLLEAGTYYVSIRLEGTLCDSYMDPHPDWMRKAGEYLVCS